MTGNLTLVLVVFVDRTGQKEEVIYIVSARKAEKYEQVHTKISSVKRVTISPETKRLNTKHNKRLDTDADAPALPTSAWENATTGKYYRPIKTQVSRKLDNEVLDWLRSKGEGHLTRINEILRCQMIAERW